MASDTSLSQLFPPSEIDGVPSVVHDELASDENIAWIGGPDRWGLFRATPFLLILVVAIGYLTYLGAASDSSPWQYLLWTQSAQSGTDAMILPGLVTGYLVILALAMRDPRGRWTYVVTDRRLLTFYKGRKLRELGADRVDRLKVLKGIEGRLRDIGDVVWSRGGGGGVGEGAERGPDQGRRGFRGMRQPDQWKTRLLAWATALEAMAADDAAAFVRRAATRDPDAPSDNAGARRLVNRKFGFEITLPERWVGRIGLQERAPFRILGLEMPFKQIKQSSNEPLHNPPESWNFITVAGRSGLKFKVNVKQGPPVATFEASRNKVGKSLIDADGDWRCGPLSGYRVDYLYLDKMHCRFAMLSGDGFHMLANITLPPDQTEDLLPAVDAIFDSIRANDRPGIQIGMPDQSANRRDLPT